MTEKEGDWTLPVFLRMSEDFSPPTAVGAADLLRLFVLCNGLVHVETNPLFRLEENNFKVIFKDGHRYRVTVEAERGAT